MADDKDMHMESVAHEERHKEIPKKTEGGRCLTGHSTNYKDELSCTYRWQALHEDASSRHGLYDLQPGMTAADRKRGWVKTSRYYGKESGEPYPAEYAWQVRLPQKPGDWAVGGPHRNDMRKPGVIGAASPGSDKCIPIGGNFKTSYAPYWNNAHHLIPKGTLKASINRVGKDDSDLREFIIGGLLGGGYNVNHWINVVILPMDRQVGRLLKLPRHLILEDETILEGKTEKFDHTGYGRLVSTKLDKIVKGYKDDFKPKRKKCTAWKRAKLSNEELVDLSETCFECIKKFGKTRRGAGAPLSELPSLDM